MKDRIIRPAGAATIPISSSVGLAKTKLVQVKILKSFGLTAEYTGSGNPQYSDSHVAKTHRHKAADANVQGFVRGPQFLHELAQLLYLVISFLSQQVTYPDRHEG